MISHWEQWAVKPSNGVERRPEISQTCFFGGGEDGKQGWETIHCTEEADFPKALVSGKDTQLETVIHENVSVEDSFSVSIESLYKRSAYINYSFVLYLGYRKAGEQ